MDQLTAEIQPLAEKILQSRELKKWEPTIAYEEMETRFNPMVWDIAVPAAAELYDGDSRIMNRRMAELSGQVLMSKPTVYVNWLGKAAKRSVRSAIEITLRNPIVLVTLPMWLMAFAWKWRKKLDERECKDSCIFDREFQAIVWLALGYAICKMGLVILVEPPIDRYCAPASVFLASVLAMAACQAILRGRERRCHAPPVV